MAASLRRRIERTARERAIVHVKIAGKTYTSEAWAAMNECWDHYGRVSFDALRLYGIEDRAEREAVMLLAARGP